MSHSLQQRLISFLQSRYEKGAGGWVSKGDITRIAWSDVQGRVYLPETVGRALRLAEESSRIAVRYHGKNTMYKWLPEHVRGSYITTATREGGSMFRQGDYAVTLPL